ncbi:DUF3024 domain-containing protein [uncultured Polaribacter sp.]|uniref:DUF3024 domain-containing protein n=1 Tax=uncultured Polaribacter sp. TaxID=174711 RepID=UPI00260AD413|nr:DUF3024 domain-containing protein [uncultured Polaribacter sp.]
MANKVIDINEATIKKYVESLRPEDLEMRKQVDIGYSYDGKVVILYEIRPDFMNPKEKIQLEFAKFRYYKSKKEWNLYWMKSDEKWQLYQPFPVSTHLGEIIEVIKKDKHGCFFG